MASMYTFIGFLLLQTIIYTTWATPIAPAFPHRLIVGGVEATPHEFPSIVQIQWWNGAQMCGGTIIASEWVLTAAHCMTLSTGVYGSFVAGQHNLTVIENGEQRTRISKIILHEEYFANETAIVNDIALVKVTPGFRYTETVQRAALPLPGFEAEGMTTVAGWGTLRRQGPLPDVLMKVDVPVIPRETCGQIYRADEGYSLTEANICAGYEAGGKDSCQGDSGGPLMCQDPSNGGTPILCGVVSWGGLGDGSCAAPGEPGVYTNVSHYYQWILEKVLTE